MGLGRRSSTPAAPPIPMPALPPSAYGISVPGAPAVPQQPLPPVPAGPPPPVNAAPVPSPYAAPPAASAYAAPSPYAAPPVPSPYMASPSQFGAPPSQFGAAPPQFGAAPPQFGAAPSRFGAPPATFGGQQPSPFAAPPVPYGTQSWPAPTKTRGTGKWAKAFAGAFVFLVLCSVGIHWYAAANKRHVGAMPSILSDATADTSPQTQAVISAETTQMMQSPNASKITHLQVGIFRSTSVEVVALIADIPSNSAAFRDDLLNSGVNENGANFASVTPGVQGGSESCEVTGTRAACVWADDGTMGVVFVTTPDQAAAMAYLQALRDATEH